MKRFLLVSVLVWALILTWCSQQKWLSQNELFEKKQKCASYKDEIQKEISKQLWVNSLNEIFYSPTRNSCMYRYSNVNAEAVVDYFTKEVVIDALNLFDTNDTGVQKTLMEGQKTFTKWLKQLKWE